MGTRSLTRVYDEENSLVLFMYRQFDGYPSGMGRDLKKIVGRLRLVNGMSDDDPKVANGMGCLAAQIVAGLKIQPGGIYIKAISDDIGWADYVYDFRPNLPGYPNLNDKVGRHIVLKVTSQYSPKVIFEGPVSEFDPDMKYGEEEE